jgi:hypothetical protein
MADNSVCDRDADNLSKIENHIADMKQFVDNARERVERGEKLPDSDVLRLIDLQCRLDRASAVPQSPEVKANCSQPQLDRYDAIIRAEATLRDNIAEFLQGHWLKGLKLICSFSSNYDGQKPARETPAFEASARLRAQPPVEGIGLRN